MPKKDIIPPPPEKEVEQVPDIREVFTVPNERMRLAKLIERQYILGQEEKAARDERKPLTDQIKKILGENQIGKMQCNDYRVNYYGSPRSTLSKDLLLSHGVSPKIIAACTVTSTSYTLKITTGDEEDEG